MFFVQGWLGFPVLIVACWSLVKRVCCFTSRLVDKRHQLDLQIESAPTLNAFFVPNVIDGEYEKSMALQPILVVT